MLNYLPYIFGLASFLGGLYLFMLSFRIYIPKHKTEEQIDRYQKILEKFGKLMKVGSIFLILNGCYDLIIHDNDRYKIGLRQWTESDKLFIIDDLKKSKYIALYPQFADKACECMANNIVNNLDVNNYKEIMKLEPNKRFIQLRPFIQSCLDEFRKQTYSIDPPDKNGWTNQDKLILINEIKTSSKMLSKYPQFAEEASNCMADKIINAINHDKYVEINLKPQNEKFEMLIPLIKSCSDTLNDRIKIYESKKNIL